MRILVAGEACNVKITLRPLTTDVAPQHKFQIEARYLTPEELEKLPNVQPDALWSSSATAPMRIRMNCSFGDYVPSGVQLSFPAHDDARSEVSFMSEAPTNATNARTPPTKVEGTKTASPTTSAPMSLDALQHEVQRLRQSLTSAESSRQTADTRVDALKADLEASQAECKALQQKYNAARGGSGFFRKLLNLAVLGGVLSLGYQYGLPVLCPAPPECVCDGSAAVAPAGGVRLVAVSDAAVPTGYAAGELETGPGLEKADEL
eukprot:EG_transcript_17046